MIRLFLPVSFISPVSNLFFKGRMESKISKVNSYGDIFIFGSWFLYHGYFTSSDRYSYKWLGLVVNSGLIPSDPKDCIFCSSFFSSIYHIIIFITIMLISYILWFYAFFSASDTGSWGAPFTQQQKFHANFCCCIQWIK